MIEETLRAARAWTTRAGIADVFELTQLDCLGVPVVAVDRPQSRAERFTYGKGEDRLRAEVSALMEAIEFFFAEPGNGEVVTKWGTPLDVYGGYQDEEAILDFPPVLKRNVELKGRLRLARATILGSQQEAWIPAELVFHPAGDVGHSLFGSTTTGLSAGNNIVEASLHALLEILERDVWSFHMVRRNSTLLDQATLPEGIRTTLERAKAHGLEFVVRHLPNEYGLPCFAAFLFDPRNPTRRFFNGGWGCHLDKTAAVWSAVREAAQSRLAFIHGGRQEPKRAQAMDDAILERQIKSVLDRSRMLSFEDVPEVAWDEPLGARLDVVVACIRRVTDKPIFRVVYTAADDPLQVLRLVVPLMEDFRENLPKVGRRLKMAIDADAGLK